jgi:glycosyltransferase involved in cell wall biosynthesis
MEKSSKPIVNLIIPVHNEAQNISWFFDKLTAATSELKDYDFNFIFVDDGSTDESLNIIKKLASNKSVKYVSFSRNFGKEAATSAGLEIAEGDAAIMIDADGQHPVELIKSFVEKWQEGYEVVIGVRKANSKEGFIKRYGSKVFYTLLGSITGAKTVSGATDYRLLDKKVVTEFKKLTEHNRMTRGLIDWLGFNRTYIAFTSPARHSGTATYGYRKLVKLALHGFVSQTTKPLQVTGLLGFFVTIISFFLSVFLFIEQYIFSDPLNLNVTGTAMLALFLSFLVGLVLICQWLLALYVESIHNETQNRPLYIVSEKSR